MKTLLLLVLVCALGFSALTYSEQEVPLAGIVLDWETGAPLVGANIRIPSIEKGTSSDSSGRFSLTLFPRTYEIEIGYMGYTSERRQVHLIAGTEGVALEIRLEPTILPSPSVSVTAKREPVAGTVHTIQRRDLHNIPTPLPDALLTLHSLPGVSTLNDQSHRFNVHGGSIDENLITLDGIPLPQLLLIRKGVAENPSLINPELMDSIQLHTAAIPVHMEDRLSSVVQVDYRDRSERPVEGSVNLSTIGTRAALFYQPQPGLHLAVGGRWINYGYLFSALQTEGDYRPDFKDIQARLRYVVSDRLSITAYGLTADSRFFLEPSNWSYKRLDKGYFYSQLQGQESFDARIHMAAVKVDATVSNTLSITARLSHQQQEEQERTDLDETTYLSHDVRIQPTPDRYDDKLGWIDRVDGVFRGRQSTLQIDSHWDLIPQLDVTAGVMWKDFYLNGRYARETMQLDRSDTALPGTVVDSDYHADLEGNRAALYLQGRWSMLPALSLRGGIRWTRHSLNQESLLLPRLALSWTPLSGTSLSLTGGRYAQPPMYKEYQFRTADQSTLYAQKADQITLGFSSRLSPRLQLDGEFYYRWLSDLISFDQKDVWLAYSGRNDAEGYAYGLDVRLQGEWLPGTSNWVSYSYLVAREDLEGDAYGYVPRPTDRRHLMTIYMEDRMERFPFSRFHVRLLYGSGYPYTWERWEYDEEAGRYWLKKGPRNQFRMVFYARFDVGFTQTFELGNDLSLQLREEVLNLFNHYNVLSHQVAFGQQIDRSLGGRTYNIGVQISI